jgi:hypothetical protein
MIDDAKIMQKIELAKYFGLIFVYETSATLPSTFLLPRFLSQEMAKRKQNIYIYIKMFGYYKKK